MTEDSETYTGERNGTEYTIERRSDNEWVVTIDGEEYTRESAEKAELVVDGILGQTGKPRGEEDWREW